MCDACFLFLKLVDALQFLGHLKLIPFALVSNLVSLGDVVIIIFVIKLYIFDVKHKPRLMRGWVLTAWGVLAFQMC